MLTEDQFKRAIHDKNVERIHASLPQKEAVQRDDLERWIHFMSERPDFHDPYWHYRRKFGIGGSEAIVAVQVAGLARGEEAVFDAFATPATLVADKTFKTLPSPASGKMMRGNYLEEGIANLLLKSLNAERLDEATEALHSVGTIPDHPWLVGHPDLIMRHRGKTWLVDIKAPDEAGTEVPLRYVAQLHHYAARAAAAGVRIDGLMIGNFDYLQGRVIPVVVDFHPRLARDLLEGGDRLWEHILTGSMPSYLTQVAVKAPQAPRPLSEDEQQRIQQLEAKAITAKLFADRLTEIVSACQKEIRKIHEGRLAPGMKAADVGLKFYNLNLSEQPRMDVVQHLIDTGKVKHDEIMIPQKVDVLGMIESLRNLGIDPAPFILSYKVNEEKLNGVLVEHDIPKSEVFETRSSYVYRVPKSGERLEFHEATLEKIERLIKAMRLELEASSPSTPLSP